MSSFSPTGVVTTFTDHLLAGDLPDLDPARRAEAAQFAARRTSGMASPMRVGVVAVAAVVDVAGRVVGPARLAHFLGARSWPVLGEYVRLVRSLTYAYVWETWPETGPTGAAA